MSDWLPHNQNQRQRMCAFDATQVNGAFEKQAEESDSLLVG